MTPSVALLVVFVRCALALTGALVLSTRYLNR
jgi:hypothetical protein